MSHIEISKPRSLMQIITRTLLSTLLAAACASTVFAADPPAKKDAKAAGPMLTKEQLRNCIAQREKVSAEAAELKTEQAAVATQKEQIERSGNELKSKIDSVDRTKAEEVAAYNEAVQARDKQIDAYQSRTSAFNARVDANQAAHSAFTEGCSNKRFLDDDEAAIKKGK
jgi:chromosome segregation ATPase